MVRTLPAQLLHFPAPYSKLTLCPREHVKDVRETRSCPFYRRGPRSPLKAADEQKGLLVRDRQELLLPRRRCGTHTREARGSEGRVK